ncbi:MAG: hypothetical protein H7338_02325 [Candidatus Sericytochromatia bacterium]|nr:hypothetical protein [Candidatus Sericytochromatia bacterium]
MNAPIGPMRPEASPVTIRQDGLQVTGIGTAKPSTALFTADADLPGKPPATAAEARSRAERIVVPVVVEQSNYGQTEREALKPDEYHFYWRVNLVPIEKMVKENAVLVQPALKALSDPQRKQFQALWNQTVDDIGARLSLQLLLIEGTLTAQAPGEGNGTLLSHLEHLASPKVPLMKGLERAALICDMMQEIAFPSSISQRSKGTCTMTAVQMFMAKQRPAELARIIGQLAAASEPVAPLANGDVLRREPGTETDDESGRTVPSRLFQAAAMEYMDEVGDYDNALDRQRQPDGSLTAGGSGTKMARTLKGLLGPGYYVERLSSDQFESPKAMVAVIAESVSNGHPVAISLQHLPALGEEIGSGHAVLMTGVTNNRLDYLNPWGKVESMSFDQLAETVVEAVFVNSNGPQAPVVALPTIPAGR